MVKAKCITSIPGYRCFKGFTEMLVEMAIYRHAAA